MTQAQKDYIKQEENIKTMQEILIPRGINWLFG